MNRKAILLGSSCLVVIVILSISFFLYRYSKLKCVDTLLQEQTLVFEDMQRLQAGDFVFRMGYGLASLLLENGGGACGVSHCGILVGDTAQLAVIHSISGSLSEQDGVQICTLETFLKEAKPHSFVAMRLKRGNIQAIVSEAYRYLSLHPAFDLTFNMRDTTTLFCSELLHRVLQNTHQIQIFDDMQNALSFKCFFTSEIFDIIIDQRTFAKL